eukprot:TRINITY_DN5110_c0_g1_i2.p1 TRINITY_DN5110_c0_g1~~TRINITY_DN5110_c0_g1_i2.p1  ORF type:complete len:534 (-),score=114.85 TRINITY_DN5110_c0_g1_i2:308-1684(-)
MGIPGKLTGVNVGGWLCLEDWFYSGPGGLNVMTDGTEGQGACLPPAVPSLDAFWPSEGNLTFVLNKTYGPAFAVKAFQSHRHSYIGEDDLKAMASVGIKSVRLPMTWAAFADALAPISQEHYGKHNPHNETVIVPDPFYSDRAAFATIPRGWLEEFFRRCASHGLKVLVDLHAFPGGSADGTYNGIWPNPPAFWRNKTQLGQNDIDLSEAGLWIIEKAVSWLEGLDEQTHAGLQGLTVMNEPGHINQQKHFAKDEDILDWLASASDMFRRSKLPGKGVKLYMQLIGTAFQDWDKQVVPWVKSTFPQDERKDWVVMDQHWYTAWDAGGCDMRTSEEGGLTCDAPLDVIQKKMNSCAKDFVDGFQKDFGDGQMSISEFSAGTSQEARVACTDRQVTRAFLAEQLAVWENNGIEAFFWTWRMPFGPVFEPGWSLRWLAGMEEAHQASPCQLPHGAAPVIVP